MRKGLTAAHPFFLLLAVSNQKINEFLEWFTIVYSYASSLWMHKTVLGASTDKSTFISSSSSDQEYVSPGCPVVGALSPPYLCAK